jgi:hypothetical protein
MSLKRKLAHSSLTMTDRFVQLASDPAAIIQERVAPLGEPGTKPIRVQRGCWMHTGSVPCHPASLPAVYRR